MKQLISMLATSIAIGGCSTVSHHTSHVQHFPIVKTESGHAYITADVGALTNYPLIIDTAANVGVMPLSNVQDVAIPEENFYEDEINGAHGASMMLTGDVPLVSLGHTTHENVEHLFVDLSSFALDDGRIPGILGHNVLQHYCVSLDLKASVMSLAGHTFTITPR